jgi:hypothetical protein
MVEARGGGRSGKVVVEVKTMKGLRKGDCSDEGKSIQ